MTFSLNLLELEHLLLFGSNVLQKVALLETSVNSIIGYCYIFLSFALPNTLQNTMLVGIF